MFIYSLPLFFTDIGFISQFDLLFISIALFVALFIASFFAEKNTQKKSLDNYLFSAWYGEIELKWVFWPFFLILNVCFYVADTLAKSGTLTVSAWDDVYFILCLPVIWWEVSIWRCSENTSLGIWAACARFLTFGVFAEYGLKLLIRVDYPRLFFECDELLLDYGSCF